MFFSFYLLVSQPHCKGNSFLIDSKNLQDVFLINSCFHDINQEKGYFKSLCTETAAVYDNIFSVCDNNVTERETGIKYTPRF